MAAKLSIVCFIGLLVETISTQYIGPNIPNQGFVCPNAAINGNVCQNIPLNGNYQNCATNIYQNSANNMFQNSANNMFQNSANNICQNAQLNGFSNQRPYRLVSGYLTIAQSDKPNVHLHSDNLLISGPVNVAGKLPFAGTVAIEGALPAAGAGAVNYACGNNVGIISEVPMVTGIVGPNCAY